MKAASCFSGIGGAECAWPEAEWLWCAEIEPAPASILAARFPHSTNLGDVLADDFIARAKAFGPLDLLCGGPPCQAFSVAGLRGGMADPRGQLSLRFVEIAHAIRPRNLLVENVPGWLNHEDNAFGCFLGAIVGADDALRSPLERGRWPDVGMVAGPRARAAWRVFDAQYFGLAQRRQRVFVVVDFGEGADPATVLFEPDRGVGDPAASRKAGQGVAHPVAPCLTSSGRGIERTGETRGQDPVVAVLPQGYEGQIAPTLNAAFGSKLGLDNQHIDGGGDCSLPTVSMCLNAGAMGRRDAETETLIPVNRCDFDDAVSHTLRGEGFDASEDGTGRGTPLVPIAMQAGMVRENPNSGPDGKGWQPDLAYTLEARAEVQAVAFDTTQLTSPANYSNPQPGDPCHSLASRAHVPAVAFTQNQREELREIDVSGALSAEPGTHQQAYIATEWAVRRLTPAECETLQGYPPGHTLIETYKRRTVDADEADYLRDHGAIVTLGNDGKLRTNAMADGPRYKGLGNAWAVLCARWIIARLTTPHKEPTQ